MPTIRLTTQIDAPVERCFDLARSVDIHLDSAAHTHEQAVAGVTTGLLGYGDCVTWEAVHFGVRQRLTIKVTMFDPPNRFVDELVDGTFRELRHLHEFSAIGSQTRMVDVFTFHSPLGVLGQFTDALVLARYLRTFLCKRNTHLKMVAESC